MADPTPLARASDPEVPARATRLHDSARCKAQVLLEYDALDAAGRGAVLGHAPQPALSGGRTSAECESPMLWACSNGSGSCSRPSRPGHARAATSWPRTCCRATSSPSSRGRPDSEPREFEHCLSIADRPSREVLPPHNLLRRYLPRYDRLFARRFLAATFAVVWKLRAPGVYLLACVAEELVMRTLIEIASDTLEFDGREADFGELEATVFEDLGHDSLFDDQYDGVEEPEVGRKLGITPLSLSSWFDNFRDDYVHPYACEGPVIECERVVEDDSEDE